MLRWHYSSVNKAVQLRQLTIREKGVVMEKIGASVAIRSAGMSLVLGSVWFVGSMGISSAEATVSFPSPKGRDFR